MLVPLPGRSVLCVTAWLGVGGTGFSLKNWKGNKAEPHSLVGCFLQPVRNGSRRVHGAIQEGPHPHGPPPLPRQGSGLGVTNGSVKDIAAQAQLPHHPFCPAKLSRFVSLLLSQALRSGSSVAGPPQPLSFLFLQFIFIYLAVPGLSCSMWDLIPCPGTKPGPST